MAGSSGGPTWTLRPPWYCRSRKICTWLAFARRSPSWVEEVFIELSLLSCLIGLEERVRILMTNSSQLITGRPPRPAATRIMLLHLAMFLFQSKFFARFRFKWTLMMLISFLEEGGEQALVIILTRLNRTKHLETKEILIDALLTLDDAVLDSDIGVQAQFPKQLFANTIDLELDTRSRIQICRSVLFYVG
jgi:hypothetical protein